MIETLNPNLIISTSVAVFVLVIFFLVSFSFVSNVIIPLYLDILTEEYNIEN